MSIMYFFDFVCQYVHQFKFNTLAINTCTVYYTFILWLLVDKKTSKVLSLKRVLNCH